MKSFGAPLTALAAASLAACGSVGNLQYPEDGPPPAPLARDEPPTIDALLDLPPQAAPDRLDDPLRRSEERGEDEFDLPPR